MAAPHPLLVLILLGDVDEIELTMPVAESAREHGVAAIVSRLLSESGRTGDPAAWELLTMSELEVAAEYAAALDTTRTLLAVADDLSIDIAVFKGVTIAALHYEQPDARPTIDVDAFVAPHDAHRMGELASALGASDGEARAIDAMVTEGRVFEHTIPVGSSAVDLHRDPMNMVVPTTQERDRWDRIVTVPLPDGGKVATLDLEDRIIQACLHLFRDNFADLLHVNDVRLMVEANPDWDDVERRTHLDGWTDLVRFAVWFVSDTFGHPSPLPTTIDRWRKAAIDRMWPRDLLLQGAHSVVRSERRQSALDLLGGAGPGRLASAYVGRLFPPRSVIEARGGPSGRPYPQALLAWRADQRRDLRQWRREAGS